MEAYSKSNYAEEILSSNIQEDTLCDDNEENEANKNLLSLTLYYKRLAKTYKKQLVEAHHTIKELNETLLHVEANSNREHRSKSKDLKKFIDKCNNYCEKINNFNSPVNSITSDIDSTYETLSTKQRFIKHTLKKTLKEKYQLQDIMKYISNYLEKQMPNVKIDRDNLNNSVYVKELLGETSKFNKSDKKLKGDCPSDELPSVEFYTNCMHMFQNLFDVKCHQNIPTRMTEIYYRYGQLTNFKQSIINILDLDSNISSERIMCAIQSMYNQVNDMTGKNLREFLNSNNLQTIVNKIQLHDEFMPLFNKLLDTIMKTLEISRLDQIMPSIKALKILSTPSKS